ncbi:ABC transporter ATP-binding protein [Fibrella arboris]|uniref:ABC transporter ATP-binding protein n=1 Tax=Fibrella arboris TaxID=3242486 RepID=UPI00351F99B9
MIELAVAFPRLFTEGTGHLELNISLAQGSLTAVIGPSGSGKTTLLRLLAGLETPQEGHILVGGQVWYDQPSGKNLPPQQRSIGYVFQDTALFPNMTVLENITYAASGLPRTQVEELIEATGLTTFAHSKPTRLSGGQRQRVALARALVRRPQVLLLDEPFSALDAEATAQLRQLLLSLHRAWGTTTLLVSHHAADVNALADRILQLRQGKIVEDKPSTRPDTSTSLTGKIRRIWFDEANGQWVVDTEGLQLRSDNPAWGNLKVGTFIDLSWH